MKHPMPAIAGIAFVLFAPAAFAQAGGPPMNEQEQVQREEQERQNRANEHAMAPKRTAADAKPFEQLDRNRVGYLTLDDARRDAWLSEHFVQCDLDGNNRVSREEYGTCTEKRD